MIIPKKLMVGFTKYTIRQPETLPYYRRGYVYYDTAIISIAKRPALPQAQDYSEAERATTFWHELTHAILHDMEHPLRNNEGFVTGFSTRLAKAIRTAEL